MLKLTNIVVDAHIFALKTKIEVARRTVLRATLPSLTQTAVCLLLRCIMQVIPALTFFLIIDQPCQMLIIHFLRKLLYAIFAYSKVAGLIVIDTGVEHRSIHATDIADILQVRIFEEVELVTNWACFLGARWHPAINAVFFITFSADGSA